MKMIIRSILLLMLLCSPALAQQEQIASASAPYKLEPIDPTKNVISLVEALEKTLAELRIADNKYQDAMRDGDRRRTDELRDQRLYYEKIIEDMRAGSLKLLAEQLKENKADSSERMSKLEQFRWETGGQGTTLITIMMVISLLASVAGPLIAVYAVRSRLPARPTKP